MTKDEFISKQVTLKYYALKTCLVWVGGMGLFLFWPSLFKGRSDQQGTNTLFVICFFIYLFGGAVLIGCINIRKQKQIGSFCPKCRKRFYKASAKIILSTGKCGRCGEMIISEWASNWFSPMNPSKGPPRISWQTILKKRANLMPTNKKSA